VKSFWFDALSLREPEAASLESAMARNCASLRDGFAQKHLMENDSKKPSGDKNFLQWAITPPQSYALYLGALILIFVSSFYIGTMKPKNAVGLTPPPVSVPRN
jgi:hypothetical protein